MRAVALAVLVVASICVSGARAASDACASTLVSDDGADSFNISRFASVSMSVNVPGSGATPSSLYTLALCRSVTCGSNLDAAGCQAQRTPTGTKARTLGKANEREFSFDVDENESGFVAHFYEGDTCGKGTSAAPREMHVTFLCDATVAAATVTFDGETSHCLYEFTVRSALACPTPVVPDWDAPVGCSRLNVGTGASAAYFVPERLARAIDNPYHADAGIDAFDYDVNICAPVSCRDSGLDPDAVAGACQRGKDVHAIGRLDATSFAAKADVSQGYVITMSGGAKCKSSGVYRTTVVDVTCSPGEPTPRLVFDSETSKCSYHFTLYASERWGGCPISVGVAPSPPAPALGSCPDILYYSANQHYYRTSALALPSNAPYTVIDSNADSDDSSKAVTRYTFNICGDVQCGSEIAHTGACQLQPDGDAVTLGLSNAVTVAAALPLGSGFTVTYMGGQSCSTGPRKTVIHAVCDMSLAGSPAVASFDEETSHCVYEFTVRSAAACAADRVVPPPAPKCGAELAAVTAPDKWYEYLSLTRLVTDPFVMDVDFDDMDYSFTVNVCGQVSCPGMHLAADTQVVGCQSWKGSDGKVHERALGALGQCALESKADDDGFKLTCSGGDECSNGDARALVLDATCDATAVEPVIEFKGESSHCVYTFGVRSAHACPIVHKLAPSPKRGLSGGAVAAIVVLVALVVGSCAFVAYRLLVVGEMPDITELSAKCGSWCASMTGSGPSMYKFERLAVEDPEGGTEGISIQ